ncbi:MAG: 50S ribosomal protein L10 [Firmicutes bacterium]|nr:50S ribosomal protein L10 [Bacillota bacterium]
MASKQILKQKEKEVKEVADKIKSAKAVILTDYRGINVEDVTNLRTKLRQANTEYAIIKNNITRRAMTECKIEGLDDALLRTNSSYFRE